MNADGTLRGLRTRHFGRPLAWLEETTSTIDYAGDWLRRGAPHGAVVIAGRQTQGRGRRGRGWASPKGGLWMSVITRPDIEPEKAGRLGLAMAVAAAEAVSAEAGCEVMLKWPNDLVLEGRKLGGVLVEAQIAAGRVSEAVLSIGVNVNISPEDLPEALGPTAISLLAATGRPHDLIAITVRLLEKLEALWPSVTGDGSALAGSWGRRDALAGREVSVSLAGKMRRGRAAGVDRQGRLLLATSLLGRTAIATGEVVSVREGQDEGPPVLAR